MVNIKKFLFALLIISPVFVFAEVQPTSLWSKEDVIKAFRFYKTVYPNIPKTSVVEVSFTRDSFSMPIFGVYNLDTKEFEPYYLSESQSSNASLTEAKGFIGSLGNQSFVHDNNYSTYLEFPLEGSVSHGEVKTTFDRPITSSSLDITLDNYVALPKSISISAVIDDREYVVLAPTKLQYQGMVSFPQTTASVWNVSFDYVQPLRISEMKFNDLSSGQTITKNLRFLAQPSQTYQIYFDADRYIQTSSKESGDLSSNTGVVWTMNASSPIRNEAYKPVDSDNDTVPDLSDNCVNVANQDQADKDMNDRGDACEDYDRDGVLNIKDNCKDLPNSTQGDVDADGVGDICDSLDNRITERIPWLPWVGIGLAGAVVLGLFIITLRYKQRSDIGA